VPKTLLNFIHISDTHYSSPDYERPPSRFDPRHGLEALVRHLKTLPYTPNFILHTGDVAYDPYPEIYDELKGIFDSLPAEVLYLPGNHDHSGALQKTLMGRESVAWPLYYETERNGVRLLMMDSNGPDVELPRGKITDDQLTWLEAKLNTDDDRPIIVAIHHPLLKIGSSDWYDDFMMTVNGEEAHAILKGAASKLVGVFSGHIHHRLTIHRDGVLYVAAPSSWTQFHIHPGQDIQTFNNLDADPGYNLVTVTDAGTFVQRIHYRVD
jgi:Icc protein